MQFYIKIKCIFFIYLVIISILSNCDFKKSESLITKENKPHPLTGQWVLTEYFDKILTEKRIGIHRGIVPAWFGAVLDIDDKGEIFLHGLLNHRSTGRNISLVGQNFYFPTNHFSNNNANLFEGDSYGERWRYGYDSLNKTITLTNIKVFGNDNDYLDTHIYQYRRNDEVEELLINQLFEFRENLSKYFAKKLIAGKYEIISPISEKGKIIEFTDNERVIGLDSSKIYYVEEFSGTLHVTGIEDKIIIQGAKYSNWLNWKFEGDILILRHFITCLDRFHLCLGKEYMRLRKISHSENFKK